MTNTSSIPEKSYLTLDNLITASAVGFMFGPLAGVVAMVASEVLSSMARTKVGDGNLPLNGRSFQEFKKPWNELGWEYAKMSLIIGLLLRLSGGGVNQAAIHWIRHHLSTPLTTLYCYFRIAVVAPLTEELVFRGFLQDRIHDIQTLAFGAKAAVSKIQSIIRVFIQAIAFGLAHYHPMQGMANLTIVTMTGIMGVIFGRMKEDSGRVTEPMGLHSLHNAAGVTRIWMIGA